MSERSASPVSAYLFTIMATAVTVAARWLLDPFLGDNLPLVTLFAAVAVGVWLGGYRTALFAVVSGFLACDYLFMKPRGSFGFNETTHFIGLVTYLITCTIIIGFGEGLRRAHRGAAERSEALRVTLASIGDAVIATDKDGLVTFMNGVAESLTGWTSEDATGKPLEDVFRILNEHTRAPVPNPALRAIQEGIILGLANHTVLISKDGTEWPIDDSGAPIRDAQGNIVGAVLVFRDISARQKAERDHAQLASIVASSEDAIISKSLGGVITSWNAAAERMFGYTSSEAIGKPITLIVPPERLEEEEAILERLRQGERIDHFETFRVSKDGKQIDISLSVSPVLDAAGRITGASKISRDISQRKRTEQELSESQERLRMAMEASQMGTWTRELNESNRTRWSAELEQIFGLNPGEFPGTEEAFFDFVHPEDRELVGEAVRGAIENHTAYTVEFRYTRRGETEPRWMVGRGRAFYDSAGKPYRLAGFGWDITARKIAEEALWQQREWLRVTLSSIGDAVITTDTNGIVSFLNPVAESLTGWTQEQTRGRPLTEVFNVVNQQTRQPVENPALRAMREGMIVGLANHTVLITRTGAEIAVDDSGAPIKDTDGKILGAVLIFRDITERRAAEERFQVAVESAPNSVVMIDEDGQIILVNSQTERLFGYARNELIGEPIEMLVPERFRIHHPEYRAGFAAVPQARPMGAGRDLFGLRKDGREVPIEIGLNPIQVKGKTLVLSSIVDITERKQTERRMEANLAITRILAESPRLSDATPRILQTVGQSLGWEVGDLWLPEENELRCVDQWHAASANVAEFMSKSRQLTLEWGVGLPGRVWASRRPAWIADVARDDNFPRSAVAEAAGLHGALGFPILLGEKCVGIMEFFSNEIRQPDQELLAMLAGIGSQIGQFIERKRAEEERTVLLAREKAAREHAEAASRAKDEFVAMVSHELRAPLNAILGWTQLLRTGKFDESETSHALEIVERNTKLQVQLIEDLLDISRVITGKLIMNMRPVELGRIVESAADSIRAAADAKSIIVDVHPGPRSCWVAGDPGRLQQIIWNLLSNAVKFTPRNGHVEVKVEREGSQVHLTVSDSGTGISPKFLPYVFDRFSQADTTGERRYGGLGLGLSIVRHIAELHGGTVRADSPGEGLGAIFTLTLPLSAFQEETPEFKRAYLLADSAEPSTATIRLDGLRVMIVDDEADTRELLTTVLSGYGAETRACSSAPDALELIERWRPSVLVSDIGLPNEDGYSLIRKVRSMGPDRGGDVPAVALTGYAKTEDRTRALGAGFQMHVPKPVEPVELVMVIASLTGLTGKRTIASG